MIKEAAVSLQFVDWESHRGLEGAGPETHSGMKHIWSLRGPRPLEALAARFGIGETGISSVRQVHGDSIRVIGPPGEEFPPRAGADVPPRDPAGDALITNRRGLAITVRTADCLPILIWDEDKKVVAAVHAGWRGSLMAIASKTVLTMRSSFGCRPADLRVGIGPAIGPCCYEVDGPVLDPLREEFGYWKEVVREKDGGKGMLDLAGLNARQLIASGVRTDRIAVADLCTFCHTERFYSYRRDGNSSGGMINGIMIGEGP